MEKVCLIARYQEDINWVDRLDCNFIVYNKGLPIERDFGSKCLETVYLENKWRGEGTYFEYIINYYGNYPEVIAFLQGDPFPHCPTIVEQINSYDKYGIQPLGDVYSSAGQIYLNDFIPLVFKSSVVREEELFFSAGDQYILQSDFLMKKSLNWWINIYDVYKNACNYGYDCYQENPDPSKVIPNHDAAHLKTLGFPTYKSWMDYSMPHVFERMMWKIFEYEE